MTRLFERHFYTAPRAYFVLRLEQARLALLTERNSLSLDRLAQRWRLGGAEQLRRQFQRYYGVSPSVYRQRFASSNSHSIEESGSCH